MVGVLPSKQTMEIVSNEAVNEVLRRMRFSLYCVEMVADHNERVCGCRVIQNWAGYLKRIGVASWRTPLPRGLVLLAQHLGPCLEVCEFALVTRP